MAFELYASNVGANQALGVGRHHRRTDIKCDEDVTLEVDQACLEVFSPPLADVELYSQSSECVGCPYWGIGTVVRNSSAYIAVNTTRDTHVMVAATSDGLPLCETTRRFGEFGTYGLDVSKCQISVNTDPVDSELPIFYMLSALLALAGLMTIYRSRHVTE